MVTGQGFVINLPLLKNKLKMENNTGVPFEVICVDNDTECFDGFGFPITEDLFIPIKGDKYTVVGILEEDGTFYYQLAGVDPYNWYDYECFRRINPYSNSVSQELAEKAMEVNIETDVPVKREVVNN